MPTALLQRRVKLTFVGQLTDHAYRIDVGLQISRTTKLVIKRFFTAFGVAGVVVIFKAYKQRNRAWFLNRHRQVRSRNLILLGHVIVHLFHRQKTDLIMDHQWTERQLTGHPCHSAFKDSAAIQSDHEQGRSLGPHHQPMPELGAA